MSAATANATLFISGINHCELRAGQQLTLDHLRALQQQLAENAGRARALQQQIQQQNQHQGVKPSAAGVVVKAETSPQSSVKKEEETVQPTPQQPAPSQQQQQLHLQYAALLALQQQARAAAAAAQVQGAGAQGAPGAQQQQQRVAEGTPAGAVQYGAGAHGLAPNGFVQQGVAAGHVLTPGPRGGAAAGGPAGLPLHATTANTPTAAAQRKQEQVAKQQARRVVEEPATDQWVQCSKCQQWRQVPDEFWPDIENGDEDEDWLCKDALWDVEDYEPHTAACC